MTENELETVHGEVVSTRMVENHDGFLRATLNTLRFRDLKGGTYKLVRVDKGVTDE